MLISTLYGWNRVKDYTPFPEIPIVASGEFAGYKWRYRASIEPDGADTTVELEGFESGGIGALPLQDIGWMVMGHFGCGGWTESLDENGDACIGCRPLTVDGPISSEVARVSVLFNSGESADALILDSNNPAYKFYFLIYPAGVSWTELVAFDAEGRELERFARVYF